MHGYRNAKVKATSHAPAQTTPDNNDSETAGGFNGLVSVKLTARCCTARTRSSAVSALANDFAACHTLLLLDCPIDPRLYTEKNQCLVGEAVAPLE